MHSDVWVVTGNETGANESWRPFSIWGWQIHFVCTKNSAWPSVSMNDEHLLVVPACAIAFPGIVAERWDVLRQHPGTGALLPGENRLNESHPPTSPRWRTGAILISSHFRMDPVLQPLLSGENILDFAFALEINAFGVAIVESRLNIRNRIAGVWSLPRSAGEG